MARRGRLHPYQFQVVFYDIVSDAERQNKAEVWLLESDWALVWRIAGRPEVVTDEEGYERFGYKKRFYVKKDHDKPPSGVLDRRSEEDDDD